MLGGKVVRMAMVALQNLMRKAWRSFVRIEVRVMALAIKTRHRRNLTP